MRHTTWCLGVAALALAATEGRAQERPPRRQAPIEIRGTVPTPQVVTVRPREIPAYSRKVLVPNFYDHDFWPSILPPYQVVPQRTLTGEVPMDSTAMRRDTTAAGLPMMLRQDSAAVRRDSLGRMVPPAARIDSMRVRPDSMRTIPPASTTPPPLHDAHARVSPPTLLAPGTAPASSARR